MQFPHCDSRVLHAKNECRYCDARPEWQALREAWGIAFTGQTPVGIAAPVNFGDDGRRYRYEVIVDRGQPAPLPCPADFNRPPNTGGDHRRWAGNVATSQEPVNESASSRMLYGCRRPPDGWTCSRQVGHEGPCAASPLADAIEEARQRPGFIERLKGNIEKHRDLLDRLR
jgi:hypothetical protein